MRRIALVLAATTALLAAPALQAKDKPTPSPAGEEKLAKLLEGREAGKPVDCLSVNDTHDATIIDKTAIVYRVGNVLYVNRPKNADQLDSDRVMVSELHTGQLCKLDAVKLHEHTGHWFMGFVTLEQFVPYRLLPKAN